MADRPPSGAATCGRCARCSPRSKTRRSNPPGLVYEPKYDGIRALVEIDPGRRAPVRIWSRLGNEKTAQFPDLVAALTRYAKKLKGPVVLDGEIVALDEQGRTRRFSAAAEPHPPDRIEQPIGRRARGVHRVRHPARRDEDLRPLPLTETEGPPRARVSQPGLAHPADERRRGGRRARALSSTRSTTDGKA